MDYNLLALLQAAQGAQRSPTLAGPVAPQSPTPGFRMPPPMSVSAPQLSQPNQGLDLSQGANMLMKGLAGFHLDSDPTNPGVPTPQGDPTGGAGPAFLGGTTPLGAVNSPQPSSQAEPGFFVRLLHSLGLLNFSQ